MHNDACGFFIIPIEVLSECGSKDPRTKNPVVKYPSQNDRQIK